MVKNWTGLEKEQGNPRYTLVLEEGEGGKTGRWATVWAFGCGRWAGTVMLVGPLGNFRNRPSAADGTGARRGQDGVPTPATQAQCREALPLTGARVPSKRLHSTLDRQLKRPNHCLDGLYPPSLGSRTMS